MRTLFIIVVFSVLAGAAFGQQTVWEPIPEREMKIDKPQVEPNADAEVLFWQVYLADNLIPRAGWQTVVNHHIRIKVFTERGRELNAKVDIAYGDYLSNSARVSVREISARTIKPDGSVIELKPQDVFDREIVKIDGLKRKAKSFAVPGIDVGVIIEYRWKEIREDVFNYSRVILAREIPVQFVKYFIKPADIPLGMRLHAVNTASRFVKESGGYYSTTMTNVPALIEEPRMPSEFEVIPWVLIYYDEDRIGITADQYWRERGQQAFESHKEILRPTSEIRAAATSAIQGATDGQDRIRRIFEDVRKNIRDINDDGAGFTPQERENYKPNKSVGDTLKRKVGNWHDLSMLFCSMLTSVGFDARFANVSTKRDARFNKSLTNDYFIRTEIVAVQNGTDWSFHDFSSRHLPFGMISAYVEGESALISDERQPIWKTVPVADASRSNQKRIADVELNETGDISGTVTIEYTGHLAAYYRDFYDDESQPEREKYFDRFVKRQIGDSATATNIVFENLRDPEKPLLLKFAINAPAYADRTGKRLFLRPNFFKRNSEPLFPSATRRFDVLFDYAWSEDDLVNLTVPKGYQAEGLVTPKTVTDAKSGSVLESTLASPEPGRLIFKRRFSFGRPEGLLIYDFNYGGIKGLWDAFHSADTFSIVLREGGATTN